MSKNPHHAARSGYAVFLAALPAGLIALHLGAQALGRGIWLPVSALLFTAGWAVWAMRARHRRIWVVTVWAIGVHLALWLPFVIASYLGGQGVGRIDYAVLAGLFTGLAVAWYVAGEYLWQTVLIGIALTALIVLRRRAGRA